MTSSSTAAAVGGLGALVLGGAGPSSGRPGHRQCSQSLRVRPVKCTVPAIAGPDLSTVSVFLSLLPAWMLASSELSILLLSTSHLCCVKMLQVARALGWALGRHSPAPCSVHVSSSRPKRVCAVRGEDWRVGCSGVMSSTSQSPPEPGSKPASASVTSHGSTITHHHQPGSPTPSSQHPGTGGRKASVSLKLFKESVNSSTKKGKEAELPFRSSPSKSTAAVSTRSRPPSPLPPEFSLPHPALGVPVPASASAGAGASDDATPQPTPALETELQTPRVAPSNDPSSTTTTATVTATPTSNSIKLVYSPRLLAPASNEQQQPPQESASLEARLAASDFYWSSSSPSSSDIETSSSSSESEWSSSSSSDESGSEDDNDNSAKPNEEYEVDMGPIQNRIDEQGGGAEASLAGSTDWSSKLVDGQGQAAATVPLEPFNHQVGGHSHIFRFSKKAVCKVHHHPLLLLLPLFFFSSIELTNDVTAAHVEGE